MSGRVKGQADGLLSWPESRNVGRNARALRLAAGRRQEDVAEGAGLKPSQLGFFERGGQRFNVERAGALARVLGTTVEALAADGRVAT